MNSLYPLKFKPILKNKIWGGSRLKTVLNKNADDHNKVGESWEVSSVEGELSVVANGFLAENNIEELIEIYMGDLVGESVYERFGTQFPLLIKFIDANDYLSIQVHPDDELADERHGSSGKTEMWYIIDAVKDAELIVGFNQQMDKAKYLSYFGSGRLRDIVNFEKVQPGDVFFMPAGRIHATGPGILFAEIQQTSDITYRIYDWDRLGDDGKPRELHTELAVDAIDYEFHNSFKTAYQVLKNKSSEIVKCPYFTTNFLNFDKPLELEYHWLDSFVIYMAMEGSATIRFDTDETPVKISKGETVLIPADLKEIRLIPETENVKILEVYIEEEGSILNKG